MKLVTDSKEYGIRKGFWPFYSYVDLEDNHITWTVSNYVMKYCFHHDKEKVIKILHRLKSTDKITVVKDI